MFAAHEEVAIQHSAKTVSRFLWSGKDVRTMNSDITFSRGYLICVNNTIRETPHPVLNWDQESIGRFNIYTHPLLPSERQDNIILLGRAIDPVNNEGDTESIVSILRDCLSRNKSTFLDYLDNLSGRFVLFVQRDDEVFAVGDATGSKSLLFAEDNPVLSSHVDLIAKTGNYNRQSFAEQVINSDASSYPGLATEYQGIHQLPPNTLLHVEERNIERIFPREPLETRELTSNLIEEVADLLTSQFNLLVEEHDLVLSLSAGIDSRLSFAASREVRDQIDYYTWIFDDQKGLDVSVASALCDHVGVQHNSYRIDEDPDQDFLNAFRTHATDVTRGRNRARNAYNHYQKFPPEKLEIRSNISEIGRSYYRNKFAGLPNTPNASILTKLYGHVFSDEIREAFREFIHLTSFHNTGLYNYDPYDLFYWEYKMGRWLSQWLIEKDVSHDNFILFNNREILKRMLSLSLSERMDAELFYQVIDFLWPECLDIPLNPSKNVGSWYRQEAKRAAYGLAIRQPLPIYRRIIDIHRR